MPNISNIVDFKKGSTYPENFSNDSEGVENMDIEKYIDRLDQDRRDSEQRAREDRQHMETRLTEERRLSEERLCKQLEEFRREGKERDERIDKKFEKATSEIRSHLYWTIGTSIATILAIAGLVIAVWFK